MALCTLKTSLSWNGKEWKLKWKLKFYWININDLQNYKLIPNSTYELIKDSGNIKHIIEKQKYI